MSGFVHFYRKRGIEYAEWRVSVRRGAQVTHERRNLGRVVDRERLIFKLRGTAPYGINADGTPRGLTADELAAIAARDVATGAATWGAEHDPLDFGDAFFAVSYLRQLGLSQVLVSLVEDRADAASCLLVHQVLCPGEGTSTLFAWWKGSYASYLFPVAPFDVQGIRACLGELGCTDVRERLTSACDELSGNEGGRSSAAWARGVASAPYDDDNPVSAGQQVLAHVATSVRERLQCDLATRVPSKTAWGASVALMSLRNHKARVYDRALVPFPPAPENAVLYDAFEIEVPATIPWERDDPRQFRDTDVIAGDSLDA